MKNALIKEFKMSEKELVQEILKENVSGVYNYSTSSSSEEFKLEYEILAESNTISLKSTNSETYRASARSRRP